MSDGFRIRLIERAAFAGLAVVALTETLSLAHLMTRTVALCVWIPAIAVAVSFIVARSFRAALQRQLIALTVYERAAIAGIAFIAAVTLVLAIVSPPSSLDALSYHVPRISHWIQNSSIAPYPTHVDRQIWIGPGAEFFTLWLQLITGTDRFAGMIQWISFIGCIIAASQLAKESGAPRRGQIFAAFVMATLPIGIMQASSAQVDLFASFWMAASIILLLRLRRLEVIGLVSSITLGACIGIAILAKGTAYVILAPFILWCSISGVKRLRTKAIVPALVTIAIALGINAGQYARNYSVFGNPFSNPHFPSVVNETVTPTIIVSNVVRNVSAQTGSGISVLNTLQETAIARLHSAMGLSESDPRTSFSNTQFRGVWNARDEEAGGNPFHLVLLLIVFVLLAIKWRTSPRSEVLYACALLSSFLLFCAVFKWQIWISRLHVPFFVIAAALIATVLARSLSTRWMRVLGVLLFAASLPPLLRNRTRPLIAKSPIFTLPLEQRYFVENTNMYAPMVAVANFLENSQCRKFGFISGFADQEELLWVVLRNRISGSFELRHVAVTADEYPPVARGTETAAPVCALVTQFAYRSVQPRGFEFPPGFSLALDRGPMKVYLPAVRY